MRSKELTMNTGVVKFFNSEKGYGFITDDKTKQDIFVHFSSINSDGYKTLEKDQKVSYEIVKDPKDESKSKATNVTVLK